MVFTRNSAKASQPTISIDTSVNTETISMQSTDPLDTDILHNPPEPIVVNVGTESKSLTRHQTLEELEQELFNSSDSSDDEDFSYKKKTIQGAGAQPEEIGESNTIFVIDRAADSEGVSDPSPPVDTTKESRSHTTEDKELLIKKLSKAPTSIQVDEVAVADRSSLVESTSKSAHSEIMKKAVISAGFEKQHVVPTYSEGKKAMARKRREERATTKTGWFDMKAPEMTEELEADLQAVQMRGSTASWTGYKKNDYKNGPKFFQIATVQDSPIDFYHSRIAKKDRKRTIVDELLADADFRKNNKKMYVKAVEKLNKRHPNKKGGRHATKSKR